MNSNYYTARVITLTIYTAAGVLAAGSFIVRGLSGIAVAVLVLSWFAGFVTLLMLNQNRGIKPSVYCMVFDVLLSILTIGYCFIFDNEYLILFGFFTECMACTLFLDLSSCKFMVLINMLIVLFFCFFNKAHLGKSPNTYEVISILVLYMMCTWLDAVLIKTVKTRDRNNLEQAQSLDDFLKVVEAKCEDAQNANKAKSDFLAKMSHEIRTPINAVLGLDTMILRESREVHTKNYAMDIQNEGQILLSLINDILDFSKIESGKLELFPVEYELSSLLNDVYNMIIFKASEKNLEIVFNIDENIPANLFGDDVRIRQILTNILDNAVKYTEQGHVKLELSGEMDDNAVILHFSISDTGIGIKKEDMNRLFEEFERIDEARTRNIQGSGLGMSITIRLLNMMNSQLKVESQYGEGSSFSFDIRQPVMNMEVIGNLQERLENKSVCYSYAASFVNPDINVLVVDDNYANRKVFTSLLKETQAKIDEAEDGYEALKVVAERKYDIIFLDHMMPGIDGIEVLKRIKQMDECPNKDTPIIALTANAVSGAKEMYISEGFDDFLSKPIKPERLEHMIADKLGIEKQEREVEVNQSTTEIGRRIMDMDGVDWDYAISNLGSERLIIDTAKDFCKICEGERRALEEQLAEIQENNGASKEAYDAYRIKVHSMKTSAAMIGNVSLFGVAKMLEYAARDEKIEVLINVTPVFLDSWTKFGEEMRNVFPELNKRDKKPINHELICSYIKMLTQSIQEMEIDTADEIVAQLKGFYFPDKLLSIVNELESAVSNIDEEKVFSLTEQLSEGLKES